MDAQITGAFPTRPRKSWQPEQLNTKVYRGTIKKINFCFARNLSPLTGRSETSPGFVSLQSKQNQWLIF